ncbi:MAG: MFS transporter [Bacteroidetes bacterium]|nr:MFS transporter [Bacteroidota bacterium]
MVYSYHSQFVSHLKLPLLVKISFAAGMGGWSILVNIIGVMLPYFYLPPKDEGLPVLISQFALFGIFNLLAMITTAGRLTDAFYDPFIGQLSDRSGHKRGRRIPFMQWSFIPAIILCALVFCPPMQAVARNNAYWLVITLSLFFVAATTYIIPCNALLPEMSRSAEDRVSLATLQQVGFVIGIVIASSTNNLAHLLKDIFHLETKFLSVQYAIGVLCFIAGIFMLLPVIFIDEKKYCEGKPSHMPLFKAIRATLKNKKFLLYASADFSWYMALYIITSGLLYYVTVLAGLNEKLGVVLMGTMVAASLIFYPAMNTLAKRFGKKKIVILAFFVLAAVSACVYGIGHYPIGTKAQLFIFVIIASFPLAALGILPPAILADIAVEDAKATGENREGLFFAVKFFVVKLGQTLGIAVFAMLTLFGKDTGHDHGLRLSGIVVAVLCVVAAFVFSFFRETK